MVLQSVTSNIYISICSFDFISDYCYRSCDARTQLSKFSNTSFTKVAPSHLFLLNNSTNLRLKGIIFSLVLNLDLYRGTGKFQKQLNVPGDLVTKVKQINSQSDLIWMTSFAGPSYLTVRSSVYIILMWDPWISNLYNLCQTGSNYIRREPQQYAVHFNE